MRYRTLNNSDKILRYLQPSLCQSLGYIQISVRHWCELTFLYLLCFKKNSKMYHSYTLKSQKRMYLAKSIPTEHKDIIHDVSFDFYGRRMATCSSDHTVKVGFMLTHYIKLNNFHCCFLEILLCLFDAHSFVVTIFTLLWWPIFAKQLKKII